MLHTLNVSNIKVIKKQNKKLKKSVKEWHNAPQFCKGSEISLLTWLTVLLLLILKHTDKNYI